MVQVISYPISRSEALTIAHDMLLLDTPDYLIRRTLVDYGFHLDEANSIIREARTLDSTHETHINPRMMALGLAVVTTIMTLMLLLLILSNF